MSADSAEVRLPFVGRQRQLDQLARACRGLEDGRAAMLHVHGRSGAGKSALVSRFLHGIEDPETVILAGRCFEQESVPYKALDGLVDSVSRHLLRRSLEESRELMPPDIAALARIFPVLDRVEAVGQAPTRVEGEIRVSHAVINGTVVGPVFGGEYVELQAKCNVTGDVNYRTLEIQLGAVVQGRLVHQESQQDTKLITLDYSPTLESESYRDIRTKLLFMNQNQQLSSFLVTSLRPGEGKSLTSSNLAITFAQQKISTLLIDGDLRRGVLHNVYGNNKKPGLGDFLISKATVDFDNVSKLVQKTIIPNLYLITNIEGRPSAIVWTFR